MTTEIKKTNIEQRPRTSRAKRIGVGVIALATAGGAAHLISNYQSPQEREAEATEAEALRSLEKGNGQIINSVFVFNEGVNIRKEPLRKSEQKAGDGSNIDITNEAFTVSKGERLVVSRPFRVKHEDGDEYIGFTLHDQVPDKDASENTYYIALSALQNQQQQEGSELLFEEYSLGNSQETYTYNSSTGELTGDDNRDIANAQRMSVEDAEFLISTLPLASQGS